MELKVYDFKTIIRGDYSFVIHDLLQSVSDKHICALTFFGSFSKSDYHQIQLEFKQIIYEILQRKVLVTLIPQRCFSENDLSVEVYVIDDISSAVMVNQGGVVDYCYIDDKYYSLLLFEGIPSSDFSENISMQSEEVFRIIGNILSSYNMDVDDIVRQWNYIGKITEIINGRQNYQVFNDVRSAFYEVGKWHNGYPAATGIGAGFNGLLISGIAMKCKDADRTGIFTIDNPFQVPAHQYSSKVLIDNRIDAMLSTPKFERAKVIVLDNSIYCFVSGTAAICGEKSIEGMSVEEQTLRAIDNINALVTPDNMMKWIGKPYDMEFCNLRVYIKDASYYESVKLIIESCYPKVPVVYLCADVCRKELLVEIEGIMSTTIS